MNDRLVLSVYSGGIAALAANLFLFIINSQISGPRINMPQLTVQLLIEEVEFTVFVVVLGVIWSMIVGGIYAFLYIIMLDYTGWSHLLLKAVAVITGVWLVAAGPAMHLLEILQEARENPISVGAFFLAHLVFAMVLKFLVAGLAENN